MRMRSELSKKNQYYISAYRYLELKYFCLQYDDWRKRLLEISELPSDPELSSDVTGNVATERTILSDKIKMVEDCARNADAFIGGWILLSVTKGVSYNTLYSKYRIPASKGLFFNRYHKFFWLLNNRK